MTETDTCGGEYHHLAICSQPQDGSGSDILLSYLKGLLALEKELHIVTDYQSSHERVASYTRYSGHVGVT